MDAFVATGAISSCGHAARPGGLGAWGGGVGWPGGSRGGGGWGLVEDGSSGPGGWWFGVGTGASCCRFTLEVETLRTRSFEGLARLLSASQLLLELGLLN